MADSVLPHNFHDAVLYVVWGILVFAAGFEAVAGLLAGQFKKAIAGVCLMVALAAPALYWGQIVAALPDWKLVAMGAAIIYVMLIGSEFFSLRGDFGTFIAPRELANRQAKALQDYLSKRSPSPVTVKVNAQDQEALDYAAHIADALRKSPWEVEFSTADGDPGVGATGLYIFEEGENSKVRNPKNDPREDLQRALTAAKIPPNGGGGRGAGTYKLFLVVGRRPLRLNQNPSIFFRLGMWFNHLGHKLHK